MVSALHPAVGGTARLQLHSLLPRLTTQTLWSGTTSQGFAASLLHPLPALTPGLASHSTLWPSPACHGARRLRHATSTHAAAAGSVTTASQSHSVQSPAVPATSVSAPACATASAGHPAPQRRPAAAIVLGIESSCDDTGVAVVTSDGRVLGEAIATQADIHAQWGGVVPNLARDAHAAAIDRTVASALAAAGLGPRQLSAIAVTIGPGLGLCLRVGAAKARELARQYGIPLVSVHHMEAHALVARLPTAAAAAAPPAVRLATTRGPATSAESDGTAGTSSQPVLLVQQQAPPEASQRPGEQQVAAEQQQQSPGLQRAAPSSGPPSEPQGQQATRTDAHTACRTSSPPAAAPAFRSTHSSSNECHASNGTSNAHTAASASEHSPTRAAHLDAAAVGSDVASAASLPFPFLCLLVSGGHNLLVLVRGVGDYVQLGTTVDDALGEAYDKVARLLELELRPHGGAALEALAREGDPKAFRFAVPMRKYATCDFSFAGLKTSTRLAIEQRLRPELLAGMSREEVHQLKADIAASFQSVAVTHLSEKARRGVAWARELAPGLRHLVVAGGVACNRTVRGALQQLAESEGLELVLPPPRWCTDNGVMVAWAGIERIATGWAEPPPPPLAAADAVPHASAHSLPTGAVRPGAGVEEAVVTAASGNGTELETNASSDTNVAGAGLVGANPGAQALGPGSDGEEWIELKPRWPLTSALHPRSAAAQQQERRSVKRVRMHTALSDLTPPPPKAAGPAAMAVGATAGATVGAAAGATAGVY